MGGPSRKISNGVSLIASHPDIISLVQWCHRKSEEFKKLQISPAEFKISTANNSDTDSYRGICSLKRINHGEQILCMPETCLVTSNAFPKEFDTLGAKLNLHEKFAVHLIMQLQKCESEATRSQIFPYLKTLPQEFSSHHPGYLSETELELLPTWCSKPLESQKASIEEGYVKSQELLQALGAKDFVTFEEYRYAWYTVYTRTVFYAKQDCQGNLTREMALAPFLDLFNHAPEPNTKVEYVQGQGYTITATRDIFPLEQIFISYGPHPNYKLWTDYGFVPFQRNPHNGIPLSFRELSENDWLRVVLNDRRKMTVIKDHGLTNELYLLENELSPNLELLIAVVIWDPDEEKFSFHVEKSCSFLKIATNIIMNQKQCLVKSLISFDSLKATSVVKVTKNFIQDCIALCDKLSDLYGITGR